MILLVGQSRGTLLLTLVSIVMILRWSLAFLLIHTRGTHHARPGRVRARNTLRLGLLLLRLLPTRS